MKNIIEKIHNLNPNSKNYVLEFEDYLSEIAVLNEPSSIPLLINLLNDDEEYDELMFSIVHTIENFEDAIYLKNLLPELDILFQKSPKWASILVMRILNSNSTRNELTKIITNTSNSTKDTLMRIFNTLKTKDEKWIYLTQKVLF